MGGSCVGRVCVCVFVFVSFLEAMERGDFREKRNVVNAYELTITRDFGAEDWCEW